MHRILLFSLILRSFFSLGQTPKVAIIGGGIAGLSSAYYLHKADSIANITLFEKEKQVGGNAQTKTVLNARGEKVNIDIGPQYFANQSWEKYIEFLKELGIYSNLDIASMQGSFVIENSDTKKEVFVTPIKGSFRGEKLSTLLKFRKLNMKAWKAYKNPTKWKGVSMESWVNSLHFDSAYKHQIVYPFLASALGTTVSEIKTTSCIEVLKLFAFRKPKLSNEFNVLKQGMGNTLIEVGKRLEQKVKLRTESTVLEVQKLAQGYKVVYLVNNVQHEEFFDFVIIATHADQAKKLIEKEAQWNTLSNILNKLHYFKANIVLHKDDSFVSKTQPSFLNIQIDSTNEVLCNTMNLGQISPDFEGLYKSWMDEATMQKVKDKGLYLEHTLFYHPLISVDFVKALDELSLYMTNQSDFSIVGGWSQGIETQNTAIISAQLGVAKYLTFKNHQP